MMNILNIIWLASGVIIFVYLIFWIVRTYNRLVDLRVKVDRQSAHVEAHLKEKYDMIPALVNVVKGYAKHEKETFVEVTRLRSQWMKCKNINEKHKIETKLDSLISKLLIIHKRYPELKANKNFIYLQRSISKVEAQLLYERKAITKGLVGIIC